MRIFMFVGKEYGGEMVDEVAPGPIGKPNRRRRMAYRILINFVLIIWGN